MYVTALWGVDFPSFSFPFFFSLLWILGLANHAVKGFYAEKRLHYLDIQLSTTSFHFERLWPHKVINELNAIILQQCTDINFTVNGGYFSEGLYVMWQNTMDSIVIDG
jgi:hypothetical protein